MPKIRARDPKLDALHRRRCLNPHPNRVADPLFASTDFFDARDLVQVKYEMVRRVRVDRQAISRSAKAFGFSRPAFYQADAAMARGGIGALLPKKRGPRRAHKLSAEVVDFLLREQQEDASLRSPQLAHRLREHFGIVVHPRSIERALSRQEKKRR